MSLDGARQRPHEPTPTASVSNASWSMTHAGLGRAATCGLETRALRPSPAGARQTKTPETMVGTEDEDDECEDGGEEDDQQERDEEKS